MTAIEQIKNALESKEWIWIILYFGTILIILILGYWSVRGIYHAAYPDKSMSPALSAANNKGIVQTGPSSTASQTFVSELATYTWTNKDSWKDTLKAVKPSVSNGHGKFEATLILTAGDGNPPTQLCAILRSDVPITNFAGFPAMTIGTCIQNPRAIQKALVSFASMPHNLEIDLK